MTKSSRLSIGPVNNNKLKTRQIFTLFHELAHLLMHTGGVDTRQSDYIEYLTGNDKRIEMLCNQFAAEFLGSLAFGVGSAMFPIASGSPLQAYSVPVFSPVGNVGGFHHGPMVVVSPCARPSGSSGGR